MRSNRLPAGMESWVAARERPQLQRSHASIVAHFVVGIPALLARGLIQIYRHSLSAFVGRTCRHLPTCSEYADIAVGRFGLWRGGWMALARFWRCRPLGTHGFDPVPEILPGDARWYRPWRYGRWASIQPD